MPDAELDHPRLLELHDHQHRAGGPGPLRGRGAFTPAASTPSSATDTSKFIKDSINQLTWWAIGTKGGGEVVSSDAY